MRHNIPTFFESLCTNETNTENVIEVKPTIQSAWKPEDNTCKFCGKKFSRKWSLQFHIESVHQGIKYDCKSCKFSTTKKNVLAKTEGGARMVVYGSEV